jgi:hypothetical protein
MIRLRDEVACSKSIATLTPFGPMRDVSGFSRGGTT